MVDVNIKAIDVAFEGDVASLNVKPMSAALVAGILRPMLAEINMVSAPAVAKERGVVVAESRQDQSPVYDSLVRVTVTTEMGRRAFAGTIIGGAPRIVEVKSMDLDAAFAPAMLYINNLDKPGFIGALGVMLGEAGINIATFNLGRRTSGEDAIALVGVDQPLDETMLNRVRDLPHVKEARSLVF